MSAKTLAIGFLLMLLASAGSGAFAGDQQSALNRRFQAAVAQYQSGNDSSAVSILKDLLLRSPDNFATHELLGVIYAGQSQYAQAVEQLRIAVRLDPTSAAARTNLATSLERANEPRQAGAQFRKALILEPNNYSANHNLGEFDIKLGEIAEAQPLLARAQQIEPGAYDNGYDLAVADLTLDRLGEARQVVNGLLANRNTGELHNLLAQIDEKDGKYVDAADQFSVAAHIDPSERNLFAWGSELLLHHTYQPATQVFQAAAGRYPDSFELQAGLGMAFYARGLDQEAVRSLMQAIELNPKDPEGYSLLEGVFTSSPEDVNEVIQMFRRYARLHPDDAQAQYDYAMCLWMRARLNGSNGDALKVVARLQRAIDLDSSFAKAYLQLGEVYSYRRDYRRSIPAYQRALACDSTFSDAHYKLGIAYARVGQKQRAQQEFAIYRTLMLRHMAKTDKKRSEIERFIVRESGISTQRP